MFVPYALAPLLLRVQAPRLAIIFTAAQEGVLLWKMRELEFLVTTRNHRLVTLQF